MSYNVNKNELQMTRSKIIDKFFKELTPEKLEEMRLKRIAKTKALTMEYQLGWYVGNEIVSRTLPTLSVDMLQTRNCIKVSNDEELEAKRLNDVWYANYDENVKNDSNWIALRKYHAMLEEKYLPQVLECHIAPLNVENMDEFKRGVRGSLWDSDLCHYDITDNDSIEVLDDEDGYFTIIKLKYKKSDYGTD